MFKAKRKHSLDGYSIVDDMTNLDRKLAAKREKNANIWLDKSACIIGKTFTGGIPLCPLCKRGPCVVLGVTS